MIDFEPMARASLLLVRPGSLIMTAPAFGDMFAPVHLRVGLTMLLAFTLAPVVAVPEVTGALALGVDRKSTRLNSSHPSKSRMPSSA